MDDELIMYTLALLMAEVRWSQAGDATPLQRRFKTVTRRIKLFNEVDATAQPWCGQAEHGLQEAQVTGMPYKTILEANWFVLQCVAKDDKAIGAILNNLIMKGVRDALKPKPADPGFADKRNTLGGLVYHCFISGRVFKDPGDLDGQGLMIIPIKLLVP